MGVLGVRREFVPREAITVQAKPNQINRESIKELLNRIFKIGPKPSLFGVGELGVATPMGDYSLSVLGLTIYHEESDGRFTCEFSAQIKLPHSEDRGAFNVSEKGDRFLLEKLLTAAAEHVLSQISSELGNHKIDVGAYPFPTGMPEDPERAYWHNQGSMEAFVLAGRITTVRP